MYFIILPYPIIILLIFQHITIIVFYTYSYFILLYCLYYYIIALSYRGELANAYKLPNETILKYAGRIKDLKFAILDGHQ